MSSGTLTHKLNTHMCCGRERANLAAQDAVHHDNDESLQGVEDSEEDLEESGAAVRDGQHRRHPGQRQEREDHAGAPQRRPAGQRVSTTSGWSVWCVIRCVQCFLPSPLFQLDVCDAVFGHKLVENQNTNYHVDLKTHRRRQCSVQFSYNGVDAGDQ